MMKLTRRELLLSGAAASVVPLGSVRAAEASAPKYLVVLFVNGGWDVTFAMDPKPDDGLVDGPWVDMSPQNPNDVEEVRVLNGIPVQCNDSKRKAVTSFFETWGDRCCVINGIWTGSIVHQPSRIRLLTGTQTASHADFATIVGASKGVSVDLPLGTVDFSGLGYVGQFAATTGRTGYSSQLKALLDPSSAFGAPSGADYALPLWTPSSVEDEAIHAHLTSRIEAFRKKFGAAPGNGHLIDGMLESYARRERLLVNAETIAGRLSLGATASLGLQASVAVDLLDGGVCHSVTIAEPDPVWDTHDLNVGQHSHYNETFTVLNVLLDDLQTRGLLEDTLVVVMSEMTRTPKRNWKTGKDHWGHTSQLWIGAGVSGGRVVGGTNASVESLPINLETGEIDEAGGALNKYDNLVAGLLEHLGVDPGDHLPGVVPFRAATA